MTHFDPWPATQVERNFRTWIEMAPLEHVESVVRALVWATTLRRIPGSTHLQCALSEIEEANRSARSVTDGMA